MKRSNGITWCKEHRVVLLCSVFFLCLLLYYFRMNDSPLEEEKVTGVADSFTTYEEKSDEYGDTLEQKTESSGRLLVSVRDKESALPLRNPFSNEALGEEEKLQIEKDKKKENSIIIGSKGEGKKATLKVVSTQKEGKTVMPPRVIGIILGDIPLAIVEQGGECELYATNEGPTGYKITHITAEEVWWEQGLAYRH